MDGLLLIAVLLAVLGLGLVAVFLWAWWSERDWD
jgi:hypothetical protein